MHVPARHQLARGVARRLADHRRAGRRRHPRPEADQVAGLLGQVVIGQVVGGDHVAQHLAEHPPRRGRAGFLQQRLDRDPPALLAAAMFARQLVDAPLQRLPEAEIIAGKRQHRFCQHRPVQPVAERHRHADHAAAAGAAHDLPAFDQAKAAGGLGGAGDDIGGDAGAGQPLEGLAQPAIGIAAGLAIGRHQQVMRLQLQRAADLAPGIQRRHQLADAEDQDVLVMDGGQPLDAGRHLHAHPVVAIAQDPPVGPRRQREQRMFHAGQVVLGQRIENIAEEKIALAVPVGQQPVGAASQCLSHGRSARLVFVVSVTPSLKLSTRANNGGSESRHRGSGVTLSGVQSHPGGANRLICKAGSAPGRRRNSK